MELVGFEHCTRRFVARDVYYSLQMLNCIVAIFINYTLSHYLGEFQYTTENIVARLFDVITVNSCFVDFYIMSYIFYILSYIEGRSVHVCLFVCKYVFFSFHTDLYCRKKSYHFSLNSVLITEIVCCD